MKDELRKAGVEKIIAFSGSVPRELEARAEQVVEDSFQTWQEYKGRIAIQTGGTDFDIQKYAAERAKRLHIPVIGVFPARGKKYEIKDLDFAIEVSPRCGESEWGDDTEVFAKIAQGVEMIGGSLGTLIELGHLMKINDSKIRNLIDPVYIAPVVFQGARTTADVAYDFPFKQEQRVCLPSVQIVENGREAARFLVERLKIASPN
jgi:hypothetical protein